MNELKESFDTAKREAEWTQEMERLIEIKKSKCIVCLKHPCDCEPVAMMNHIEAGT